DVAAHPEPRRDADLPPPFLERLLRAHPDDEATVLGGGAGAATTALVSVVGLAGRRWLLVVEDGDPAAAARDGALAELTRVARLALGTGGAVAELERARRSADAALHRVIAISRLVELAPESLDQTGTVGAVLAALVPYVGDWAVLHLVRPDGGLEPAGARHVDPAGERLLDELGDFPLPADIGLRRDWLARDAPIVLAEDELRAAAGDAGRAAALAPLSALAVALRSAGAAFGLLVVGTSHSGQRFGRDELRLMRELGKLAALAVSSARLYAVAERARREREDVVAIVSHDLRNPLQTIRFASQVLALPGLPEAKRGEQLARLDRAIGQMESLLQDLLDASRIEAGRFSVRPRPIAAAGLVEEACRLALPQAEQKEVALTVDPAPEVGVEVEADREAVLRVFGNLLSNALSFTPRGGGVALGLQPRDEVVWFHVRDTGPGIEPEILPHVFDRYWQAKRASHTGAGLGLAIARGIVEAHGGQIAARTRPEGGAELCFSLRRASR
ncbi:MAG TPA: HAMP domain-containing sensor histidine kinase, partial [Thermoanaerobaculia bacterium]|nr:HAMP domain-containing sensor histidine kinase [Thermoanaerobaculia bacterium]